MQVDLIFKSWNKNYETTQFFYYQFSFIELGIYVNLF